MACHANEGRLRGFHVYVLAESHEGIRGGGADYVCGYASLMMTPHMVWNGNVYLSAETEPANLIEGQPSAAGRGKAIVFDEFKWVARAYNPLVAKPDLKCRYVNKKCLHVASVRRRRRDSNENVRMIAATCGGLMPLADTLRMTSVGMLPDRFQGCGCCSPLG